jgi:pimeloyl-ACP methyl ester carboxylesterase
MLFMPFQFLGLWLRGLLAIAFLGFGVWLLKYWYDHRYVDVWTTLPADSSPRSPNQEEASSPAVRRVSWQPGLNRETAALLGGLALFGLSIGGGSLLYPLLRRQGGDEPHAPSDGQTRRLQRPDGTQLHVELYGPEDGPPIILTHGWGLDCRTWDYLTSSLAERHRLIVWDLPGLGRSSQPANRDYSLEKMARDLDAVVALASKRPATLVGHSIGGMIMLTFCRLFPESLGERVSRLVLVHTTYTNPVKTTEHAGLYSAVQKPLLEPMLHVTIGLSPLVWLMNLLSYLNGSAHRFTESGSFSGGETRSQLNLMARYVVKDWPAVLARGMLAMFGFDETSTLASITVPTLIVAGDGDTMTLPEASLTMAGSIPKATLLQLEPARHAGHLEHHARFAQAVREFVSMPVDSRVSPAT